MSVIKFFPKTALLALTTLFPLASCGPQYQDVNIYPESFSGFKDGKNTIAIESMEVVNKSWNCVVSMDVQEDAYYLSDIKEMARLTNEQTGMVYTLSVIDDTAMLPFPDYRERHIEFSSVNSKSASPSIDGSASWIFSFRYQTHNFLFHIGTMSEI